MDDDGLEFVRIENPHRFTEGTDAEPLDAQLFGDLLDRGGLLKHVDGVDEGIQHVKQEQRDVFVKMKVAIAGDIAFTADVVKGRQVRQEMLETLDAEELLGIQRFFGL